MTRGATPLVYVDLIKEPPKTYGQFVAAHPARRFAAGAGAAYRTYIDNFQPWRVLIRSGDNYEPLFRSTERYFNEADARHAIELAFGPGSNVYLRQAEHGNVELRLAQ